jgi:hypothetical protein
MPEHGTFWRLFVTDPSRHGMQPSMHATYAQQYCTCHGHPATGLAGATGGTGSTFEVEYGRL